MVDGRETLTHQPRVFKLTAEGVRPRTALVQVDLAEVVEEDAQWPTQVANDQVVVAVAG